jgi:hypothetical protein
VIVLVFAAIWLRICKENTNASCIFFIYRYSVADPGCFAPLIPDPTIAPSRIWIPDPEGKKHRIPDPGVKKHRIPDPSYFCIKAINKFC